MAVPKRRVSHTRAAKRRTHYKITLKKPSNSIQSIRKNGKRLKIIYIKVTKISSND